MPKIRILLVEDEAITAEDLRIELQKMGYEACSLAPTGEKAIEIKRSSLMWRSWI